MASSSGAVGVEMAGGLHLVMETLPLKPEQLAQLEAFRRRRGKTDLPGSHGAIVCRSARSDLAISAYCFALINRNVPETWRHLVRMPVLAHGQAFSASRFHFGVDARVQRLVGCLPDAGPDADRTPSGLDSCDRLDAHATIVSPGVVPQEPGGVKWKARSLQD